MEFRIIITLLSVFMLGFSSGKKYLAKGMALRAQQLIKEGDKEAASFYQRLLNEKRDPS